MKSYQTIKEIKRGDLLIVTPWIWKPITVFIWTFLWIFIYYGFLKDVVLIAPEIFKKGEPSSVLAFLAIFGAIILFVYWTVSSIYYSVIKDIAVRVTANQDTLAIKIGRIIHSVNNNDIEEIRLKKIFDINNSYSFNLSLVTKEKHLLLLIKSDEAISYELADRLNQMTNAEIKMY